MKTAIVTGSNRGIGRAIALRLAQDGMSIVLCARDQDLLNSVAKTIGQNALAVPIDLRLPDSGAKVVDAALARFGAIDILVNNAGATKRGDFEALTDEDFIDGFALKFFGAVRLTRAAWPHLRKQSGSIVNIVGAGGRTPGAMFSIGGSVNAAVLSFTKAMSEKGIQDGVQVNAINPGPVRTAPSNLGSKRPPRKLSAGKNELPALESPKTSRLWSRSFSARRAVFCRAH
jgi:NAD(P)-dependent dehydrogenase (short-subunit alcohol dehydrogenase family)